MQCIKPIKSIEKVNLYESERCKILYLRKLDYNVFLDDTKAAKK
jgi:hypothetical protein